jgi:2-hydroxychromene-2-carboxylate isomerase
MHNLFRAISVGACGVPSYQVNDGAVIWGQDRLNIVADLLCGWKDPVQNAISKL